MANKKWIQKANRQMKRKGTVGKFTEYCGGRVTQGCIDKAKRSDDPTFVRRAVFAENMRGLGRRKKAQSDLVSWKMRRLDQSGQPRSTTSTGRTTTTVSSIRIA